MQAGRLEIEVVAEVARLQEDMRKMQRIVGQATGSMSRDAKAANDNFRSIGRSSEQAGRDIAAYGQELDRVRAKYNPQFAAINRYKMALAEIRQAHKVGAISIDEMNAAIGRNRRATLGQLRDLRNSADGIAASTGAMTSGLQQAGFQVSDFAVQVGGGTSAIRAASQQMPQFIQALSLMGMGADKTKGKFSAFLGVLSGPWGIALTVAASVAGALASQLLEVEEASEDVEFASYALGDAQSVLGGVIDLTTGKINTQSGALFALAEAQILVNQVQAQARLDEANAAIRASRSNPLVRGAMPGPMGGALTALNFIVGDDTPGQQRQLADDFLSGGKDSRAAVKTLKELKDAGVITATTFNQLAAAYANAGVEAQNLEVWNEAEEALNGNNDALKQFLNLSDKAGSKHKDRISDAEKAQKKQTEETLRFIESLENEIATLGLDEKATRQLDVARQMAAAQTEAEKKRIAELNILREKKIALVEREKKAEEAAKENTKFVEQVADLERQLAVMGLVGIEREKAMLQLEHLAQMEALQRDIKAAELAGEIELVAQLKKRLELLQKIYGLNVKKIETAKAIDDAAERTRIWNEELLKTMQLLEQIGGVGGLLSGLLGLASGNTRAVGGPFGEFLNLKTGALMPEIGADGKETGRMIARTLGDELRDVFKLDGEFGKTMTTLLQGAGGGLIAGNAFGFNSTTGQLGSAIGGALGQKLGEEFLAKGFESIAKGLGAAAGPLGAIAGGLLGGALGSLLSSTPRGSATIGNVGGALGVTGTRGTSQARIAAATDSANGILDSLNALAAELGATIDPSKGSVSIGIRKKNYRVDTSGSGITKTSKGAIDFGQDAEAAALYAMQDLIRDGVLVGLRKGTENLLKNTSDLEVGVQKALAFEGVFTELKALQDPLGAALDSLEKEGERLRDIFEEAGATVEEYAQLEELLTIKRQDAIDAEQQRLIDDQRDRIDLEVQILSLLGREQEALTLARETELAAMEASLRPLQSMVYQLEDARAVIEQFGPLAEELRAYKQDLLGSNVRDSYGLAAARFRDTAALAGTGDATALGQLSGVSTEFLDAAKANAKSRLEYDRAVGEVLGAVDQGIFAADAQVEYAQLQIDAINANSDILMGLRSELRSTQERLVEQGEKIERIYRRWDGDGLRIRNDADTPVYTEVVV